MNDYVLVKVEGKNVLNYIKWLLSIKITILKMTIQSHKELYLTIHYKDYPQLNKYSKTYKTTIIKKYGKLKILDDIKNNIILLVSFIISIFFLYYLSNYIFKIDVIYNDKEIVKIITNELSKYDIAKYKKKKSYDYLTKVKKKILEDNQDILEWLEIEEMGTKYTIRLVERKKEPLKNEYPYQSIVAKKDAIITNIVAYSGVKQKGINSYVKKDEPIISGIIIKPDGTSIYTKASGLVLGEVWYKAVIEYPMHYYEEKLTGSTRRTLAINFLNKRVSLFPYRKYKQFNSKSQTLIKASFIPLSLEKEKIYELEIEERIYTSEEATKKALEVVCEKLKTSHSEIKFIKDIKVINREDMNSKIKLNVFIKAVENIGTIREDLPPSD